MERFVAGEEQALAERLADGLERVLSVGDSASYEAVYATDYVEEYPQSGERIEGRETIRRMLDAFPTGTRPSVAGPRRVTRTEDGFVAEYLLDYGSGGRYHIIGLYTVRDGRIAGGREYFAAPFDPADWRRPFTS